jgi:hypothetical protein
MHPVRFCISALILLALGAGERGEAERIVLRSEPDTELARAYLEQTSWTLETVEVLMNGSPVLDDVPEVTVESERRVLVSDEVLAGEQGRTLELRRSYEEIASHSRLRLETDETEIELHVRCGGALEGDSVEFEWDAEEEEYARSFGERASADSELLDGLEAELDLTELLPAQAVEIDDEWEIDAEMLSRLLVPGGELGWRPREYTPGGMGSIPTPCLFAAAMGNLGDATGALDGEASAKLAEIGEEDGARVARIVVGLDLESEIDRSERLCSYLVAAELSDEGVELAFEIEIEGEAELLWDLDAGRALSLDLEAELFVNMRLLWLETMGEGEVEMDVELEAAGTTRLEVSFEE